MTVYILIGGALVAVAGWLVSQATAKAPSADTSRAAWARSVWDAWAARQPRGSDTEVLIDTEQGPIRVRLDPFGEGASTVTIFAVLPVGWALDAARCAGLLLAAHGAEHGLVAPLVPSPDAAIDVVRVLLGGDPDRVLTTLVGRAAEAPRGAADPPVPGEPAEVTLVRAVRQHDTARLVGMVHGETSLRGYALVGLVEIGAIAAAGRALATLGADELPALLARVPPARRDAVEAQLATASGNARL